MFSMKNLGRASKFGESETGLKRTKVEKAKKGAQKEWKNVVWKASKKEAQKQRKKEAPSPTGSLQGRGPQTGVQKLVLKSGPRLVRILQVVCNML